MTEDNNRSMVTLVAKDGQKFTLPLEAARKSELVANALGGGDNDDDGNDDQDNNEEREVELVNVMGSCLEKVVEFLKHYNEEPMKEIPMPLPANSFNECMPQEWYREFASKMDREMIFAILGAANYMNINSLLELTCLRMTFELRGKSEKDVREYLNLPEPTKEEWDQARADHAWLFEENTN